MQPPGLSAERIAERIKNYYEPGPPQIVDPLVKSLFSKIAPLIKNYAKPTIAAFY